MYLFFHSALNANMDPEPVNSTEICRLNPNNNNSTCSVSFVCAMENKCVIVTSETILRMLLLLHVIRNLKWNTFNLRF